jgi:hypothetical protein
MNGPRPPAPDLAFLGPMRARVAVNGGRLSIDLEVEAEDVVDAMAVTKELVLDRLPGTVDTATVTSLDGRLIPPGRLFRRKRVRRPQR